MCNITKCCTEVCPEHIKITDNAIIPMKERVVDTKYDPLVWLGNKIPRRTAMAASRSLSSGDTAAAEARARDRLRDKPSDTAALRTLAESLRAQGRFLDASEATRTLVEHAGRGRIARMDALSLHAWVLLCAVEAGELSAGARRRTRSPPRCSRPSGWRAPAPCWPGRTRCTSWCTGGWPSRSSTPARPSSGTATARPGPTTWSRSPRRSPGSARASEAESAMAEAQQLWPDNPRLAGVRSNLEDMNVTTS